MAALVLSGYRKSVEDGKGNYGTYGAARLHKFISSAADRMVQDLSKKRLEATARNAGIKEANGGYEAQLDQIHYQTRQRLDRRRRFTYVPS